MNDYKSFGYYFDDIMNQIDYTDWLNYTLEYIKKNDRILDLACGSGTLIILLSAYGYKIDGLDLSESMIDVCREKCRMHHIDNNLFLKDMTDFQLDKKYNVITCFFDSVNHLSKFEDIEKMMNCVYNHLDNNGLFLFDIFSYNAFLNSVSEIEDEVMTCKYKWKIDINDNVLHHNIKIKDEDNLFEEDYYEYYYDYKKIIDDPRFQIISITSDFLNYYDEDNTGRILIALKKKMED